MLHRFKSFLNNLSRYFETKETKYFRGYEDGYEDGVGHSENIVESHLRTQSESQYKMGRRVISVHPQTGNLLAGEIIGLSVGGVDEDITTPTIKDYVTGEVMDYEYDIIDYHKDLLYFYAILSKGERYMAFYQKASDNLSYSNTTIYPTITYQMRNNGCEWL